MKQTVDFTIPFYSSETVLEIINNIYLNLYKESIDIINSSIDLNVMEQIVKPFIQPKECLFILLVILK